MADRVRMAILPAVFVDSKVLFIPKSLLLTNLQSVSPASATDRLCAAKFMSDLCGGEKCNYTYYHLPSPLRSAPLKPTPRMWGGTRMGPGMPSYLFTWSKINLMRLSFVKQHSMLHTINWLELTLQMSDKWIKLGLAFDPQL